MKSEEFTSAMVSFLARCGIRHVFEVSGVDAEALIKGFRGHSKIQFIPTNSEAAAATMAEGYCRASGRPVVVLSCGGPGLSSVVPHIAQSAQSSLPIIYLSGLPSLKSDEVGWPTSDSALVEATGCRTHLVADSRDLAFALTSIRDAIADHHPLHVSIAAAAQKSSIQSEPVLPALRPQPKEGTWTASPKLALVVGAAALRHADSIQKLALKKGIPVATDMTARGVVPEDNPLALGHLSFMGPTTAWDALVSADAIHVLAASPDLLAELRRRNLNFTSVSPAELDAWIAWAEGIDPIDKERRRWVAQGARPPLAPLPDSASSLPTHAGIVRLVASLLSESDIQVLDAGVFHQAGAFHIRARQPRTLVSTDCLTIMGWSLGAALGAALAQPGRRVVAYLGDGSFHMQGLSLSLATRLNLPVLFVVGLNGVYASSRKRHPAGPQDPALLPECDIPAVARACGVSARRCADFASLQAEVTAWAAAPAPLLIAVDVGIEDPSLAGLKTGIPSLDASHG